MKKLKNVLKSIFVILTVINYCQGQEMPNDKNEMIARMSYSSINMLKSSLINWQPEYDTIIEYDIDHFLRIPYSKKEKEELMQVILKNSKLELVHDEGFKNRYSVRLQCDLPTIEEYEFKPKINLNLINNFLTLGQDTFPLQKSALGGISEKEISFLMMSDYEIDTTQSIGGKCEFEIEFLSGYEKIELHKNGIGNQFRILSKEFTLVDVIDNYILIEGEEIDKLKGFGIINFVAQDSVVISGGFKGEMKYGQKDNPDYKHHHDMASKEVLILSEVYKTYKTQPDISQDEFMESFLPLISEEVMTKHYKVLISKVKMGDKFIVYAPTYETKKFVVEY